MRIHRVMLIAASLFLMMGLNALANEPATESDDRATTEGHCVAEARPFKLDDPTWKPDQPIKSEPVCFDTFAEAISFATDGAVNLDPAFESGNLTQEVLDSQLSSTERSSDSTVIAVDWEFSGYNGLAHIYEGQPGGCVGWGYGYDSMPGGWNDRVSSSKGFAGCNSNKLFENIDQNVHLPGATRLCTPDCPSLGVMDNAASSRTMNP